MGQSLWLCLGWVRLQWEGRGTVSACKEVMGRGKGEGGREDGKGKGTGEGEGERGRGKGWRRGKGGGEGKGRRSGLGEEGGGRVGMREGGGREEERRIRKRWKEGVGTGIHRHSCRNLHVRVSLVVTDHSFFPNQQSFSQTPPSDFSPFAPSPPLRHACSSTLQPWTATPLTPVQIFQPKKRINRLFQIMHMIIHSSEKSYTVIPEINVIILLMQTLWVILWMH